MAEAMPLIILFAGMFLSFLVAVLSVVVIAPKGGFYGSGVRVFMSLVVAVFIALAGVLFTIIFAAAYVT